MVNDIGPIITGELTTRQPPYNQWAIGLRVLYLWY